jgi:capsid protein
VQRLCVSQLARDGEVFLRKVRGFPYNRFRYALQFIDPDRVDVNYNRRAAPPGSARQRDPHGRRGRRSGSGRCATT